MGCPDAELKSLCCVLMSAGCMKGSCLLAHGVSCALSHFPGEEVDAKMDTEMPAWSSCVCVSSPRNWPMEMPQHLQEVLGQGREGRGVYKLVSSTRHGLSWSTESSSTCASQGHAAPLQQPRATASEGPRLGEVSSLTGQGVVAHTGSMANCHF